MEKLTLQQAIEKMRPAIEGEARRRQQRDLETLLHNEETEDAHAAMREALELSRAEKIKARQAVEEQRYRQGQFDADLDKFKLITGSNEDSPAFWVAFARWIVKQNLRKMPSGEDDSRCALMNGFEDGDDDLGGW